MLNTSGKRWFLMLLGLGVLALVLGQASVWLNIERVDMAYELRKMEKELSARTTLLGKLEVESNNLVSPQQLKVLAERHGLAPATSGQMRRIEAEGR